MYGHLSRLQLVQPAADVDRMHDEDVWPYSTPKNIVTSTANSGIPQEHASCADLTERLPVSIAHRQKHYRWNLSHRTPSVLCQQSNCSVEWHTEERKHERLQLHTACAELTEQTPFSMAHKQRELPEARPLC